MPFIQLFLLAVGLSMDAFAVAVTLGLGLGKATWRKALTVGLYFGAFQAGMPLIGYFAAQGFADYIRAFDTYIVFALLAFLGGKMIHGALKGDPAGNTAVALTPRIMLPFALATSIDALAVGISFAFLYINIITAVVLIGVTTLVISMAGVKVGGLFGERFKTKAAIAGGIILILIGVKVLVEGLLQR
ncbi:MAG: manganese efflux pump MntP family protein [Defluviitaleaceae bacterium]|nr:manganese efflux pump MntP family protein [Defluviitaleaceae bacterium]